MFRAEVVGSMLRPSYLKEARAAFEGGQMPVQRFKRIEDRAVDQVIATQEASGVEVVTDGEMRRFLFMGPITETVAGIEMVEHAAPELATLVDPRIRDWAAAQGMPAKRMLTDGIDLINGMVSGVSGARLAIHLCRGNNAGMWMASGGYDYIATALFERATAFDAFLLEFDDPRSGSFEPLAQAPADRQVVLGLVSTKSAREETVGEITARIDEAARSFPREQLGVSTQCGFASVAFGNPISEETASHKLRLVADVAEAVWG